MPQLDPADPDSHIGPETMPALLPPFEDLSVAAVRASPCGILAVDSSGVIVFVNPEIERIFGYRAEELIGQTLDRLIPPRVRTAHAGHRARFVAAADSRHLGAGRDLFALHRDGHEIPVEIALTNVERPEGTLTLASIIDITQRRQAEARSREREAYYRTILENVVDAVFVTDAAGHYLEVNPQACGLTGYTREELLQRSVSDTYLPEERAVAVARVASAAAGKQMRLERPLLRKDGSVIRVEVGAVRLPDGRLLSTLHDVTERHRAEAQLRESEQRFRELAEHVNEVFFVVDPQSWVALYVSPAYEAVSGRLRAEAYAGPYSWAQGVHPVDRDRLLGTAREAAERGEVTAAVFRVVRPDQSIRWVRARGTAVRDAGGRIVRLVGIAEDVTDLRRTEEQFMQAQKMEAIGRLAGGVAHDFNNLLTVITSYTQLQIDDLSPADPRRADLEEILHAAREAASLTRQLLAFSRRQVLELKVVNLNDVVSGVEKMLKRVIGEDIDLHFSPASDLGGTRADAGQLEQVIMNLAVNARDAMPMGGRLTIETANVILDAQYAAAHEPITPGPYVLLAVSDTGVGMDEATRARIFEPFFTTKEMGKGTGLGLATVYGIVKQCEGFIWAYSEPGHGATFKIYLPRVVEPAEPVKPAAEETAIPGGSETVIVVEDDAAVRRAVCTLLERWGYTVIQADRPTAALEIARGMRQAPDLLITDVIMPDMNGRELARKVEAQWPGIRTMYLSGYTDEAIVRHGVLESGVSFLQKPFTPEGLARKVRDTLDRRT
jgi:PAS domain S-box-containing protein